MIFSIDVITNDKNMKNKIMKELKVNGISKYKFKKDYKDLQRIKKLILNKYRHEIDWIEIENQGTKYIIRYEPRIENKKKVNTSFRDIIAKKNAIIYKLDVRKGEIIKDKGSYVHKGDIIVSGYIHLNDKIMDTVSATGKVYGEVWYTLSIKYPMHYYHEYKTGKKKSVYTFKLLNKSIDILIFNKYETKKIKHHTILKNNILPFKLEKQIQYETKIIDKKYKPKQALEQAIKEGRKKLSKKLKKNEYIIDYKVLDYEINNNILNSKIFYTVCENITDYQNIEEYKEEDNNAINN